MSWVVLLVVMGLQYLFPKRASALERVLQFMGIVLGPVFKYAGLAALVLLALRIIASVLGWAPPIQLGEPGDYDRRG